mmetsp:Transcript_11740/g.28935  ORF Transcript_11740/g.28935 Transcript_11740/m.28935 type:complete len:280 (-) Transcript_11740:383-1222(-)|eukprot:CAMPEP_0114499074 /NCGR_PEP_ID=MMETSP0109-20121206/7218_1 /TAXON_ID=29199 /ORGANISM="Chlorarachnion reptans, Strain CCCM449" /LENGTH=279 /DNA_ID=CAMNT_0001676607 /DNA_START=178 /DNA_END=1017 /DNA_ORIENTATION=+
MRRHINPGQPPPEAFLVPFPRYAFAPSSTTFTPDSKLMIGLVPSGFIIPKLVNTSHGTQHALSSGYTIEATRNQTPLHSHSMPERRQMNVMMPYDSTRHTPAVNSAQHLVNPPKGEKQMSISIGRSKNPLEFRRKDEQLYLPTRVTLPTDTKSDRSRSLVCWLRKDQSIPRPTPVTSPPSRPVCRSVVERRPSRRKKRRFSLHRKRCKSRQHRQKSIKRKREYKKKWDSEERRRKRAQQLKERAEIRMRRRWKAKSAIKRKNIKPVRSESDSEADDEGC